MTHMRLIKNPNNASTFIHFRLSSSLFWIFQQFLTTRVKPQLADRAVWGGGAIFGKMINAAFHFIGTLLYLLQAWGEWIGWMNSWKEAESAAGRQTGYTTTGSQTNRQKEHEEIITKIQTSSGKTDKVQGDAKLQGRSSEKNGVDM